MVDLVFVSGKNILFIIILLKKNNDKVQKMSIESALDIGVTSKYFLPLVFTFY